MLDRLFPFLVQARTPRLPGDDRQYAVIGDGASKTATCRWPAPGTFGEVPPGGVVGPIATVLESLGPEVWYARRDRRKVCLIARAERFGPAAALAFATDCVEHAAHETGEPVGSPVYASVELARRYARDRRYDAEHCHAIVGALAAFRRGFRRNARGAVGAGLAANALLGAVGDAGSLGCGMRADHGRRGDARSAEADLYVARWTLFGAAAALCGADPVRAARESTPLCRQAVARDRIANLGRGQADWAASRSDLTLDLHPLALGPGNGAAQLRAARTGGDDEGLWQMRRLGDYLRNPEARAA